MKPKFLPLLFLLFYPAPGAAQDGSLAGQEVADVVYRKLDWPLGYFNDHVAIYVGHTYKEGLPPSMPLFHEVIQMAGVTTGGSKFSIWVDDEGFHIGKMVTEVERIGFDNFQEFQRAHPHYYGAFTLQEGITLDKKTRILDWAQALKNREIPIDYIVMPGESAAKMVVNYFTTQKDLSYYGDTIGINDIKRLRCDSFVEYAYAAAGVPIARGTIGQPLNLTRKYDVAALMDMAAGMQLYPSTQRGWLATSGIDQPQLTAKDSSGNPITGETASGTISFTISDAGSGPGLLKIHKEPYDSEYGQENFTPFVAELLKDSAIQIGNIQQSSSAPFSKESGLSPGYFTATAYDHAGNSSQQFNFKIPPLSAININSASPIYNNFRGVSAISPPTLERSHTFDFNESVAGVSAVKIDGPQGNLVTWGFNPPVLSTFTALPDLPVGDYVARSYNAVGAETKTPFRIDHIEVSISTAASRVTMLNCPAPHGIFPSPCDFTANIMVEASASSALKKVELLDENDAVLVGRDINTDNSIVSLELSTTIASVYSGFPFKARATDIYGNYREKGCRLSITGSVDYNTAISFNPPAVANVQTPVMDVTAFTPAMLSGGAAIETEIIGDDSVWTDTRVLHTFIAPFTASGPIGTRQEVGHIKILTRTGDSPDLADAQEYITSDRELFFSSELLPGTTCAGEVGFLPGTDIMGVTLHAPLCYQDNAPVKKISLKRYLQIDVEITRTAPTAIVPALCGVADYNQNPPYCQDGTDVHPGVVLAGPLLYGISLVQEDLNQLVENKNVPTGNNVSLILSSNVSVAFDNVYSPGTLSFALTSGRVPNGYANASNGVVYEINRDPELSFSRAVLKFPYGIVTSGQENAMKVVKIIDSAAGKYEELDTTLDTANKTISANITSFSKFMVLAPEYSSPLEVRSQNLIDGSPELEFMSGASVSQEQYDMSSQAGQSALTALKAANKLPVGNVYTLSTDTAPFEPSGAIKMRYDGNIVSGLGVDEDSLAIYGFTESGELHKLPYLTLDKDNNTLTARVPTAEYPLFAVLASSSQAENLPPSLYPDGISPETAISFGGAAMPVSDGICISSKAAVIFTASDLQIQDAISSGVNLTNYILYPDSATVEISTYTDPVVLPGEGVYPIWYMSVDNAGNYEFPKGTTVSVDATPPETSLAVSMEDLSPGASFYAVVSGTVTLTANDPLVKGARSGIYGTFYIVDKNFTECANLMQFLANPAGQPLSFTGQPGTCENPAYIEPFRLSLGTHTVHYLSFDNVGNMESVKSAYMEMRESDNAPPETFLIINGSTIPSGGLAYMTETDSVTVSAIDPDSTGIVSGVEDIFFLVDASPESCQVEPDFIGSAGTCRNPRYSVPFSLPIGTHTVHYSAVDNAGNMSPVKSVNIYVGTPRTAVWSGLGGDGDWNNVANWRDNAAPGPYDNAVVAGRDTVYINSPAAFHSLVLGDTEGVSAPVLIVSTGITVSGAAVIHKNAILTQNTLALLQFNSLVVKAGGKIEHAANADIRRSVVNLKVAGEFLVEEGASVNLKGLGYAGGDPYIHRGGYGSGGGGESYRGWAQGGGGGYGGNGGTGYNAYSTGSEGGPGYGLLMGPTDLGSGGGQGQNQSVGAAGGGAFILEAGSVILNGSIDARGHDSDGSSGAGSGGSINLKTGNLSGIGWLNANGGYGSFAGGGGGGRIAVAASGIDTSNLIFSADGGTANGYAGNGGAGTIYVKSGANSRLLVSRTSASLGGWNGATVISSATIAAADLTLDAVVFKNAETRFEGITRISVLGSAEFSGVNRLESLTGEGNFPGGGVLLPGLNDISIATMTFPSVSTLTLSGATLRVSSLTALGSVVLESGSGRGSVLEQTGLSQWTIGNIVIKNGSKVTHRANGTQKSCAVNMRVLNDMVVEAGGSVDVSGLGYAGGLSGVNGSGSGGGGGSTVSGGGGAGYGGMGGTGSGGTVGGIWYSSVVSPNDLGSGGGGSNGVNGGSGGGRIDLAVAGMLTVNGTISADGSAGNGSGNYGSGGGSGGAILLAAANLTGTGVISASGGAGGVGSTASGGGGAGGRVSGAYLFPGGRSVAGGPGAQAGQNGTWHDPRAVQPGGRRLCSPM